MKKLVLTTAIAIGGSIAVAEMHEQEFEVNAKEKTVSTEFARSLKDGQFTGTGSNKNKSQKLYVNHSIFQAITYEGTDSQLCGNKKGMLYYKKINYLVLEALSIIL